MRLDWILMNTICPCQISKRVQFIPCMHGMCLRKTNQTAIFVLSLFMAAEEIGAVLIA